MINFKEEIHLENERVLLRPLKETDFDHLFPFAIKEPTLWKYSLLPANSEKLMKEYIALALEARQKESAYPFIIWDKQTASYAGSTRFYDYQKKHSTTQLGYTWFGKKYWGTGLNKNCKYLMLAYCFERLDLQRVEFRADNNNLRSIQAMKSIGCQVEGVLRSNCASPNGRRDSIILSILKTEWQRSVKEDLARRLT